MTRKVFVAGATGAVGRTVVRVAAERGVVLLPHARPRSAASAPAGAAIVDLADTTALAAAMGGCTTVVQLIGTMRNRFAAGDTYETSDIGTTRQLAEGIRRAKTVDHFILLSSVGAGRPIGAYLKAKAAAETIARGAGVAWTIFRPSVFDAAEGRKAPRGMGAITKALHLHSYRPIAVEDLARAILHVAAARAPLDAVLEGKSLWAVVDASKGDGQSV